MKRHWRFIPALPALMLSGCTVDLLQPAGPVGRGNRDMMVIEFIVMMCIVIPTCIATVVFAWRYRVSNKQADYKPEWAHSTKIECFIWGIPVVVIAVLACLNFWSTHYYDPYKPLSREMLAEEGAANTKPLTVQVVSLDWKWLFIYPEQGIATINELTVPIKTALNLQITSDSVMTSFFIPRLGSMVYDMAGMQTQLHLLASKPGIYEGGAAQYTGKGFSDMRFRTIALSQEQFQSWVANVRNGSSRFASSDVMDASTYPKYAKPQPCPEGHSCAYPVTYFAHAQSGLFHQIVAKYNNNMARDVKTGKMIHVQASDQASSSDPGM